MRRFALAGPVRESLQDSRIRLLSDLEYYGCNRERVRRVKAKYDPEIVFCCEQSVPVG